MGMVEDGPPQEGTPAWHGDSSKGGSNKFDKNHSLVISHTRSV